MLRPRLLKHRENIKDRQSSFSRSQPIRREESSDMATDGSITAIALLLFTTFTQGDFGVLDRSYSVNVTVGQRVSLSCLMEKEHSYRISQMEWRKQEVGGESKIAIYNPRYGTEYLWKNVSLILESSGEELKGSVLQIGEVDRWNSGNYICELITFPHGTVKAQTHLWVADVPDVRLSARVILLNRAVREGDHVTIRCDSTPSADSYSLWPSKNKSSILKNKEGRFTLPNVTRNDSDLYICQPGNSSSGLAFQGLNATVKVTVNYLDEIECDPHRSIDVAAGQNVTVTCAAKASQNSQYTWRKDNVTVSTSGSLRLWSVSSEQAGAYVFTAVVKDTDLQREMGFLIAVRTGSGDLPSSMAPPISTTTNENSHDVTLRSTAVSTATEGSAASSVDSPPTRTANSAAPERDVTTGSARPLNATATAPPFEYNGTDIGNTSNRSQPTASPNYGASLTATIHHSISSRGNTTDVGVTKTEPGDSTRYMVLIVVPVLCLLFVILFLLYRRHAVQRRMDMPPPFKPPPPPVKYVSVKTQDECGPAQQPCGNGAQWW
ncbi:hypothetical protein SKAU_G00323000 [Synaphobranchus kaupii]|uniref:Ig-like domain-containing protein n=1 Tax=Synaphobranchus kaupii TaxID=118154 RepID=A0A9Q1EP39_SYNKA|nr:hypothetical protein SKAU_G00323000 [Synaphobranchus kaupii]